MKNVELLVIGAGAAGMSAACAAWENGCRSVLLVDRESETGGILRQCLHRGFGLGLYGYELTGPELIGKLDERLSSSGVETLLETSVLRVSDDRRAILSGRDGLTELRFERMILASGCTEKSFGSLAIAGTRPEGIYSAGEAQAMLNLHGESIGNEIVILGSGDLGMIMAQTFSMRGKHVKMIIEKQEHYSAMARNYHRCVEPYGIPVVYSTEITEVSGSPHISSVTIYSSATGKREKVSCDTLISAIGMLPDTKLVGTLKNAPWLSLCGNCSRIHDIVDSAISEAEAAGKNFGGAHYA